MTDDVFIAGIAMSTFGRHRERAIHNLAGEALAGALLDADCRSDSVEVAFWSGMTNGVMQGQHAIPGQVALQRLGMHSMPIVNVENACASGSTAVHLAIQYLWSGAAEIALAIGAEKMHIGDRARTMAIFDAGWDVDRVEAGTAELAAIGTSIRPPADWKTPGSHSRFMDVYAALARWHMETYGTTARQLAAISSKNHGHSVHNPWSQYRQPWTIDDVLAADPVAYPLTRPMCAPISDGAAAAILCTRRGLQRLGVPRERAIRVAASVLRSGSRRGLDEPHLAVGALAAEAAYETAGIGPTDIDVAEVHDASAVGEAIQVENLGLVPRGQAGPAAEQGMLSLGGRIPVNTSGGLESKGHPLGATGIAQLFELTTQLRGEAGARQVPGAQCAVQENGGGFAGIEEAAVAVHVLCR
jgi:acetyl-CoA acetyltransferase